FCYHSTSKSFNDALLLLDDRKVQLDEQANRLDAIFEIANALSEAIELPQLLGQGLERIVSALELQGGQILLTGDEPASLMRLSNRIGANASHWADEQPIEIGECVCGQVAAEGKPIVINDAANDPRLVGRACASGGTPSIASVPLKAKGGSLGVLTVRSCDPHHFALNDVQFLTTLANHLGAAIENARIRTEMEDKISDLGAQVRQMAIIKERERLSREMHDGFAQTLGLLNLQIEEVKSAVVSQNWETAHEALAVMDSYLLTAQTDVREALSNLRHTAPQGKDFIRELKNVVDEFGIKNKINSKFIINTQEIIDLPAVVEVQVQRVIQEALTNVRRHAMATQVNVTVESNSDGWLLSVADDGVGFDSSQIGSVETGNFGITTMKERIESFGGRISISSQPGAGVCVSLLIPSSLDRINS
ncbi:MAG: GAF domain-containing sensor histidine kinase, partial [Anaerolineales bacterium]|nr:GAF domain-containing sensor histidine kinase [Anaerolineales bacterium]